MSLEQATALYAAVLRQLLPEGVYDTADSTHVSDDVYAHAKALAQTDLDAHRLLGVLEAIPVDLLGDYEREYGLPMQCMVPESQSIEERIKVLRWIRQHRNVMNREYLEQILAVFDTKLLGLKKYKPMQCVGKCNEPVNTERSRYKVTLIIQFNATLDLVCIISNYLPAYLYIETVFTEKIYKTSIAYPYLVNDSVMQDLSFNASISLRQAMKDTLDYDFISYGIGYEKLILRSTLQNTKAEPEKISCQVSFGQISIQSVYQKLNFKHENISSEINFRNINIDTVLISMNPIQEKITHSLKYEDLILAG
ncbi:hypothetical protein [Acinetobacter indicus]|uniref:hypothetical protein n=1 Tax=Acinetobacter indicus TaxID=756892 RepID=UPI0032B4A8BA